MSSSSGSPAVRNSMHWIKFLSSGVSESSLFFDQHQADAHARRRDRPAVIEFFDAALDRSCRTTQNTSDVRDPTIAALRRFNCSKTSPILLGQSRSKSRRRFSVCESRSKISVAIRGSQPVRKIWNRAIYPKDLTSPTLIYSALLKVCVGRGRRLRRSGGTNIGSQFEMCEFWLAISIRSCFIVQSRNCVTRADTPSADLFESD